MARRKEREYRRAIELRKGGMSVGGIAEVLGVLKSSVSLWVKGIPLPKKAEKNLRTAGWKASSKKIRKARKERWASYHSEAQEEWKLKKNDPWFMFGLALYVGEGDKGDHRVALSNCNSGVLSHFILFLESLGVLRERVRGQIHLHPGNSPEEALSFWSSELGLLDEQFTKTIVVTSKSSKKTKGNIHPKGTCNLRVGDVRVQQKIHRWMELALSSNG